MSGRARRGPGRPRTTDTISLSPYPSSPLTPDSEEGFIMNIREESRSTRVRNRPKPQPAKKTRVNAQSKLKSPIKASPIGSCTESNRENHDTITEHEHLMEVSPYPMPLDGSGQPLYEHLTSGSFGVAKRPFTDPDDELARNKVCSFCNCGVEKRMFHGKLQRYAPTPGFNPVKKLQNRHRQNSGCDPFRDRLDLDPCDSGQFVEDHPEPQPIVTRRGPGRPPGRGRRKGIVVVGLPLRTGNNDLTVDKTTYGTVKEKELCDVFEDDGYTWAHHCCAAWSEGVSQTDSYDLINVDKAVVKALTERCCHCNRFGASVVCQIPRCGKTFHYPCAASSGSFQDIKSMTMLCPDHLEDAGRLATSEAECVLCGEAKDFTELIFCTSCGRHYHGRCLEPSVDLTSVIRMGWQCPDCKVCQGCRQPGDDNRMLVCDLCDTGYHTYCLDPPMSTIPKTGWKCLGCRRCEDCGSNTPGGGPTSRWHHNFSVCDSCYQQRNKGLFCPLCGRAYRQFTDVAMVQCLSCEKWVHASCDNIDTEDYQKYNSKDLPYFCPTCKPKKGSLQLLDKNHGIELAFNEQHNDMDMSLDGPPEEDKRTLTIAAGRMSPGSIMDDDLLLDSHLDDLNTLRHFDPVLDVTDTETIPMPNLDNIEPEKLPLSEKLPLDEEMEVVVKPDHELDMLTSESCSLPSFSVANQLMDRQLSVPKALPVPSYYPPRNSLITPPKISGKRKLPSKIRSKSGGTPARKKSKHGKQGPGRPPSKLKSKAAPQTSPGKENVPKATNATEPASKEEESESLHTTLVLFSADDEFTSQQDMCLCCGSFGKGQEGQLIMCSQCGQSYHPYCVGVKINKVILTKGWRCLDCTLCEGCGKGSDEARLLLCDSCDISYHTYCLDPPLGHVPQGGWKCKWCVTCFDCGATTPGVACQWMSNYTQCGPCASKTVCPVCKIKYNTNDLMIQCAHCDRWLHGSCDGLVNEEELDRAAEYGYHCLYCRPKTKRTLVGVSGPPSPKATALHHYRPQALHDSTNSQPNGKPLHPCQRVNNNLVEVKLSSHYNKLQMTSSFPGNSIELTESGVRHMNRLKLPPGRRRVKPKVKPKKFGMPSSPIKRNSFVDHIQDKDAIFNRAYVEDGFNNMVNDMDNLRNETSFAPKLSRPRQSNVARPGVGGFVLRGRGSGGKRFVGRGTRGSVKRKGSGFPVTARGPSHFNSLGNKLSQQNYPSSLTSPSFVTKQSSFNQLEASINQGSNDSWADGSEETGLQDSYPTWMQEAFFGKDLLDTMGGEKRSKHGGKTPSTPSEDEDRANQDPFAPRQGAMYPDRQQASFAGAGQVPYQMVAGDERQHPRHAGWQPSAGTDPFPPHALNLTEDVPNPDALYKSLEMLTDDLPGNQNDSHSTNRVLAQPASQHPPAAPASQAHMPSGASTWNQTQPCAQGNDLDILCNTGDILPHVDGQEVEEIFLGIEREMTNRTFNFLDNEIDNNMPNPQGQFPQQNANPTSSHGVGYQAGHPVSAYGQAAVNQAYPSGAPHFQGVPGGPGFQHGPQNNIDGFSNSVVPGQLGFNQNSAFPRGGEFGLDDPPKPRRRPPSPRVDPLKQQQKWADDEKLGAMATISPVLYANLEHVNLKQEYPDWPNRYRAIARLWRKLSVEQRDPFRLKARDNRVRLKDQGKKLIAKNEESLHMKLQQQQLHQVQQPAQLQPQQPQQDQQDLQQQEQRQLQQHELQTQSSLQDPSQGCQLEELPTSAPIHPLVDSPMLSVSAVMPAPLTPSTPARSITPVTPGTPGPLTPTTPTTPTFSHVLAHPQMGPVIPGALGSHPSAGKTVSSKGKKSKEEKEREKELRKQRLRIQQEQERQWKILQQRRALEQQRQQQQQQQENVLLRQELKKQQQAKGPKVTDEKKKRLSKGSRRTSVQASKEQGRTAEKAGDGCGREDSHDSPQFSNSMSSLEGAESSVEETLLPVVSSFSAAPRANANALASSTQYQNPFLAHFEGKDNGMSEERQSDPSMVSSSQEHSNSNHGELHSVQTDTNNQFQRASVWPKEPAEEAMQHRDAPLWEQTQDRNQLEQSKQLDGSLNLGEVSQSHTTERHNMWTQPELTRGHLGSDDMQGRGLEHHTRPSQEALHDEQKSHGNLTSHEQMVFHGNRQQPWVPRPHPPGMPPQQLNADNGQMVHQSVPNTLPGVPFSAQQEVPITTVEQHQQQAVDLQQPPPQIPVMHWQEELSQVRAQAAAVHDVHPPQSVPSSSAPPAPPPPPPPPPLPSTQHQHTGPPQPYDISTGWPQQSQLPPQSQPQPMASFPQPPQPHQLQGPLNSQATMPQTSFQPLQQVPVQMPPNQHPTPPMSSQPQDGQLQQPQPQQQDMVQRQQREQLIRAQQQQFFQMLQHQQVLQQQQTQQQTQQQQQQPQNAAIQPGFARARFNQVVNTKDLPEIDTEEEHQERLRFLYRQRQAQKQQQIQAQLMQQAWFQQQMANGGGQGVAPPGGMLPVENPQMLQQFAQQIRPQMPDMAQQQLLAEYQRRMQQRQDLGQQTVHYDKVVQELQQQQGMPAGSTHPGGPFLEVPQQRFALRQPAPMVQPGLKPIMPYGVEGQFVGQQQQQLFKMQLQQQMMMQQQKKDPSLKGTARASPATGKVDMVKGNNEGSGEEVNRTATPAHIDGVPVSEGNTNILEELPKKSEGTGIENKQSDLKDNSTSELVTEDLETNERTSSVLLKDVKCEKETDCKESHTSGESAPENNTGVSEQGKATTSAEDTCGQANEEQCRTSNSENKKEGRDSVSDNNKTIVQAQERTSVTGDDNKSGEVEAVEKDLSITNTNNDSPSRNMSSDAVNGSECKAGEGCPVEETKVSSEPRGTNAETVHDHENTNTEGSESKREPHPQETKPLSKPDIYPEVNQVPVQPHHIPSQAPPVPPPQPQHFLMQQQFMALQQQFLQMQQQRQILVQQYQQLQQQLHQAGGQDPVLAGQVMAVQSQGQVLQQQMLQAWQQMQLIQQQLQLGGAQHQQQIAIQLPQPQVPHQPQLGPQWPAQGHLIGAQPGAFPIRPGVVGLQHPLQPGLPMADKGPEPKKGRSRSKSRDTPQPSPLGQQSPGVDWQPPKGKQTKPRQRKTKKSEAKAKDSDLERQQQMLQQQIYQQMEQRHRMMQQKQGLFVDQGQQPGPQPPMPLQQPGQQPPVSLQQHMVDNPAMLAQQPMEVPHPMRPLSHTPDLSQGPPPRPDSQMGMPPVTQGPQVPLPPTTQMPPGYPQTSEHGSFSQRFPTPEHYLQQFGQHQAHQRTPQVHYVAEANNPFSDQFQELHSKPKGRGRGKDGGKKKAGPKKPGKPRGKKAEQVASQVDPLQQQNQTNPALPEQTEWLGPTQLAQAIKQEMPEPNEAVDETPREQPSTDHTDSRESVPEASLEGSKEMEKAAAPEVTAASGLPSEQCSLAATKDNSGSNATSPEEAKKDNNMRDKETTPTEGDASPAAEKDVNESQKTSKKSRNGTGLEALQKLESMVADMANEEEACKELEKQNELERWQLDDEEYDPEMDKMYERDFLEEAQFEQSLLSPVKAVGSGSQANSVASLECHEESLISPLLDETERRKERQKFFAEVSSIDSGSLEKNTADEAKSESDGKQQDEGVTSLKASDTSDSNTCDAMKPSGDKNHVQANSSAEPTVDETKCVNESTKETSVDCARDQGQELQHESADDNKATQQETCTENGHQEEEQGQDPIASQTLQTAVSDVSQPRCESSENADPKSITTNVTGAEEKIGSADTGNSDIPSVLEVKPMIEKDNFVSIAPGNFCEVFPQTVASNVEGSIASDAVHENLVNHFESSHEPIAPLVPNSVGPAQKPAKTPKAASRPKNQQSPGEGSAKKKASPKEEDPLKKQLQELRRQEYERKKREYEEQQKKKRELQKELRIQKQMIREQRKRQKIYMNANNRKQKAEIADNTAPLKLSTPNNTHKDLKPATPLSLCEPKLLLTHALTHPYGSRPFNGQCVLKGTFGTAKVDGVVDYYSQFPAADMDIVVGHPPTPPSSLPPSPGVHPQRNDSNGQPLVNGDISPEEHERAELLALTKPRSHSQDGEHRVKRARYTESNRSGVSVPPSMPTPPLSDSAATDRLVEIISSGRQLSDTHPQSNGKESNSSSSSTSPETVQYIASSSPESDAVNRVQTPKFSALLHRESTDSPTFPAVTVKRERVEHFMDNAGTCRQSCSNDTTYTQTTCKLEAHEISRIENDSDDLDSINVTLTLSPTSEQRVTDTVASVADLIGCSPPRRSDIVIEPAGKGLATKGFMAPHSLTTPTGESVNSSAAPRSHTSSDIYQKNPFPSSQLNLPPSEETSSRKKPEGPYCRHCDVLIIGIGVKRKPDEEETVKIPVTVESNLTESDAADYKIYRVNVEGGDCTGDIFCSEACLKQYFAHFGSECSLPTQEWKSEPITEQPRLDASLTVTSVGQTSVGAGNVTSLSAGDTRGAVVADGLSPTSLRKIRSTSWKEEDVNEEVKNCKRQRQLRWRRWQQSEETKSDSKHRVELTAEEIAELLEKHNEALKPSCHTADDKRSCTLCGETGDGDNNASARLLNLDVDVWVHLNCALWSLEVYETLNGALMNVDVAVKRGTITNCVVCSKRGATVTCNQKIGLSKIGCPNNFHFSCAIADGCVFLKDKTVLCREHRPDLPVLGDLVLSSYAVYRKVYVNRDEIQQIASMLRHNQETSDKPQTLRVGSLVVRSLGQLLPHQLQSFHTRDGVYPVGFKTIRFYWSMHSVNRRCKYYCHVEDFEGIPSFTIRVENEEQKEQLVFRGKSPRDVWQQILVPILKMRKEAGLVNLFPQYITGEDLFGLSEQFVLRIIESMPGVDQMQGYNMRYGPSPIMELPLAVNPTGSARSEPLLKTHFRSSRARALRSATSSGPAASPAATVGPANSDESSGLYLKQFVYSKAAQYRKLKMEWKTNVFLGRSNIQGLGLFANKDMEAGSMVIEYIGSIIRNEVANRREQIYEKQNRGVYMFRIDSDAVIDATMAGGPARYINHSCMPNCVAEVVTFEKEQKIIIISNRKVEKGEELTYDYKFDFEDEEDKIPCLCGAPNCRKWMN